MFIDDTFSSLSLSTLYIFKGDAVAQWVERWTWDQQVMGSNPTRGKAA